MEHKTPGNTDNYINSIHAKKEATSTDFAPTILVRRHIYRHQHTIFHDIQQMLVSPDYRVRDSLGQYQWPYIIRYPPASMGDHGQGEVSIIGRNQTTNNHTFERLGLFGHVQTEAVLDFEVCQKLSQQFDSIDFRVCVNTRWQLLIYCLCLFFVYLRMFCLFHVFIFFGNLYQR